MVELSFHLSKPKRKLPQSNILQLRQFTSIAELTWKNSVNGTWASSTVAQPWHHLLPSHQPWQQLGFSSLYVSFCWSASVNTAAWAVGIPASCINALPSLTAQFLCPILLGQIPLVLGAGESVILKLEAVQPNHDERNVMFPKQICQCPRSHPH